MDVHDFHKDFLEEIKATAATEGAGSKMCIRDRFDAIV